MACGKIEYVMENETVEYRIWANMIQRCTNARHPNFGHYGGRGILIHVPWRDSFPRFLMDVGFRPSANLTLDRINNDGNYEPGNVRWSTMKIQNNNRRGVTQVTLAGISMNISEWCIVLGLGSATVARRMRSGSCIEDALLAPVLNRGRRASVA